MSTHLPMRVVVVLASMQDLLKPRMEEPHESILLLLEFDTYDTQVLDSYGISIKTADYKWGLARSTGVGWGRSSAAKSDCCEAAISVRPLSLCPSAVCTVCW